MRSILACIVCLFIGIVTGFYLAKSDSPRIIPSGGGASDRLAEKQFPHLSAKGSWVGDNAIAIENEADIDCELERKMCTMTIATINDISSGTKNLSLDRSFFEIRSLDAGALQAVDEPKDSCLRTTLLFDRSAKTMTMIKTNEASAECSQWTGYPKTWTLETDFGKLYQLNRATGH